MKRYFNTPFFIRLFNWEYWNSTIVYAPIYPYYAWLALKARSFMFLTAANPLIKNGGFIMESKKDVYDLIPPQYYPGTLYFEAGTPLLIVIRGIEEKSLTFPLIAKPDIGERGLAVKKVNNVAELEHYITYMPFAFLIQEFVSYENEVGIFYCKPPGASKGFISGIVNKEPVTVAGDGVSTLEQLVRANPRYLLQLSHIAAQQGEQMQSVLPVGESLILVPYGNHSRGSKFTDHTHRATDKLNESIDLICSQIPQFYYGRLDVRFLSWEALERGENISIIEVNGSGSEPTHIYDPEHSLFFAWKEIIRHWDLLYSISKENNRRGVKYIKLSALRSDINAFKQIDASLSARVW